MATQISKRMKIVFTIFAGVIFAGFTYAYQKILGVKRSIKFFVKSQPFDSLRSLMVITVSQEF